MISSQVFLASLADAALPSSGAVKLTHYWDCSGMDCDAMVLQPWDQTKYVASQGYAPLLPEEWGGASHGEKFWFTGAASDAMSAILAEHDAFDCPTDENQFKGCRNEACGFWKPAPEDSKGNCALIKVPTAANPDWSALVMRKNRCPPESNGCGGNNVHMDIGVPGFDANGFSTANTCDVATDLSKAESEAYGKWYEQQGKSMAEVVGDAGLLPEKYRRMVMLFAEWGWPTGNPDATYEIVECPQNFIDALENCFNANGVDESCPAANPEDQQNDEQTEAQSESQPEPQPESESQPEPEPESEQTEDQPQPQPESETEQNDDQNDSDCGGNWEWNGCHGEGSCCLPWLQFWHNMYQPMKCASQGGNNWSCVPDNSKAPYPADDQPASEETMESITEPVPESVSEPESIPEPLPESESTPEPVPESESEPISEQSQNDEDACVEPHGQCGGKEYTGATCCANLVQHWDGKEFASVCTFQDEYYSGCKPDLSNQINRRLDDVLVV